jgi:hypothetical protein
VKPETVIAWHRQSWRLFWRWKSKPLRHIGVIGGRVEVGLEAACIPPVGRRPTPVAAPPVLPARSPPQGELGFDQTAPGDPWPDMDQTAGADAGWE